MPAGGDFFLQLMLVFVSPLPMPVPVPEAGVAAVVVYAQSTIPTVDLRQLSSGISTARNETEITARSDPGSGRLASGLLVLYEYSHTLADWPISSRMRINVFDGLLVSCLITRTYEVGEQKQRQIFLTIELYFQAYKYPREVKVYRRQILPSSLLTDLVPTYGGMMQSSIRQSSS